MVMRAALARLAAPAPVPVFAVVGAGARQSVQDLALDPRIRLVATPRPANILLVAGEVPPGLAAAAAAAHDAMSHPRCTVRWMPGAGETAAVETFAGGPVVHGGGDVVDTVVDCQRDLLIGARSSEPALLPDEDPAPWRGVGPYGQGGSGMTGGVPFGRPLAERADDRDGLTLDQLPVKIGPLFAPFPPGLTLDVALQGDVVQQVTVDPNPFDGAPGAVSPAFEPFLKALTRAVPVAEIEIARARRHLRWLADALAVHGLPALGQRLLRLVAGLSASDAEAVRALERTLRRTRVLTWATSGVGVIDDARLAGLGAGPVARASGVTDDARTGDPAYERLGFEPVVGDAGDASARWRQRLAEAAEALELANRAGDIAAGGHGRVEGPGGRLEVGSSATDRMLAVLPGLLEGQEWGDAVTTIVSLDLDLGEAAATRAAPEVSAR